MGSEMCIRDRLLCVSVSASRVCFLSTMVVTKMRAIFVWSSMRDLCMCSRFMPTCAHDLCASVHDLCVPRVHEVISTCALATGVSACAICVCVHGSCAHVSTVFMCTCTHDFRLLVLFVRLDRPLFFWAGEIEKAAAAQQAPGGRPWHPGCSRRRCRHRRSEGKGHVAK